MSLIKDIQTKIKMMLPCTQKEEEKTNTILVAIIVHTFIQVKHDVHPLHMKEYKCSKREVESGENLANNTAYR